MKAPITAVCIALVSIAGSAGCGILGGSSSELAGQKDLIDIVQRVSLVPGVDALDPAGPTAVGTDWRQIVFTFTEPIAPSAVSSFDASCSLLHPGLVLDAANPPAFNATPLGLIPPRTRLIANFVAMGTGDYTITLKSGGGCPILRSDLGFTFIGSYVIHVSVEADDHKNPYIVEFRPWPAGASDEIDPGLWILSLENLVEGPAVAPHAPIRVEFSEEIRTPVPVEISPTLLGFGNGTGAVSIQVPDGIEWKTAVEKISFTDSVDGSVPDRNATVLSSQTPQGMDLDHDYRFAFHGLAPLGSYQSYVRDRSGEGLTMRLKGVRLGATTDTRTFHTAPVRIESPALGSFVNASSFTGPSAALQTRIAVCSGST